MYVILAFVITIVMNILANALPLNNQTTGEISDNFPSTFTPAGFTFSIWGLIYLSLLGFVIYQALEKQREKLSISRIQVLFIINAIANGVWIIFWHFNQVLLAFIMMLLLLATLIQIYRILYPMRSEASNLDLVCLHFPFSLYFGWITVATIANLSALQLDYGWDSIGLSEENWTLIKLAIAGTIGALMVIRHHDIIFMLVICWAAYGILSNHADNPKIYGAAVSITYLAGLLIFFELLELMRKQKKMDAES